MPSHISDHIKTAGDLAKKVTSGLDTQNTNDVALEIFQLQARHVPVYRSYIEELGVDPYGITSVDQIPYLPISMFKRYEVLMEGALVDIDFYSSGTTSGNKSMHRVSDLKLYENSCLNTFSNFIEPPEGLCILALLPNYIDQSGSSLIYMVGLFMDQSGHPDNGFFLDQFDKLEKKLEALEKSRQNTLLIGIPYALLDFFEKRKFNLKHTMIMETGGMKGRRKEMVRNELHAWLKKRTGLDRIYSEYGMTELLSQAYSTGNGIFKCPPWMRVRIREVSDPLSEARPGKSGGIDIMDLANAYSCCFISTMDLGRDLGDGNFEMLGRFDNSDVRGCNLLVQ